MATAHNKKRIRKLQERARAALDGKTSADGTIVLTIPHPSPLSPPSKLPAPGTLTQDGIYLGRYVSASCGKTFNVYAAPKNFTIDDKDRLDYDRAWSHLERMVGWHGFDGEPHCGAAEQALEAAFTRGTYKGGWVVPPAAALKLLADNRHRGALNKTFNTSSVHDGDDWFWSSTSLGDNNSVRVYELAFGQELSKNRFSGIGVLRPVRFVEVA